MNVTVPATAFSPAVMFDNTSVAFSGLALSEAAKPMLTDMFVTARDLKGWITDDLTCSKEADSNSIIYDNTIVLPDGGGSSSRAVLQTGFVPPSRYGESLPPR